MIHEITNELSKLGIVQSIKNDYVFTLLMTKDKQDLTSNGIPMKVLDIVTSWVGNEKSTIEIMKNEEDFLLLILKPKID